MEKSTACVGKWKTLERASLKSTFALALFTVKSIGSVLPADRPTSKSKTNWQTLILENQEGEQIMVDGLSLIKQSVGNKGLSDAVFAVAPKASIAGGELIVEQDGEFKAEFSISCANNVFGF